MIDTHCHILPGIDDGARTVEEALEMARIAAADGVRVIVATPHWNAVNAPFSPQMVVDEAAALQERLDEEGIPVRIEPGAEIALTGELLEAVDKADLPRLAGTKWVLVEALPYLPWDVMRRLLFELQLRGLRIVLAHPERAEPILENPDRAAELSSSGVKLQVVASDLERRWGNSVVRVARRLIKDGLADLLASDAHDAKLAAPRLSRVKRMVDKLGGPGTFERLTEQGPAAILNSRD